MADEKETLTQSSALNDVTAPKKSGAKDTNPVADKELRQWKKYAAAQIFLDRLNAEAAAYKAEWAQVGKKFQSEIDAENAKTQPKEAPSLQSKQKDPTMHETGIYKRKPATNWDISWTNDKDKDHISCRPLSSISGPRKFVEAYDLSMKFMASQGVTHIEINWGRAEDVTADRVMKLLQIAANNGLTVDFGDKVNDYLNSSNITPKQRDMIVKARDRLAANQAVKHMIDDVKNDLVLDKLAERINKRDKNFSSSNADPNNVAEYEKDKTAYLDKFLKKGGEDLKDEEALKATEEKMTAIEERIDSLQSTFSEFDNTYKVLEQAADDKTMANLGQEEVEIPSFDHGDIIKQKIGFKFLLGWDDESKFKKSLYNAKNNSDLLRNPEDVLQKISDNFTDKVAVQKRQELTKVLDNEFKELNAQKRALQEKLKELKGKLETDKKSLDGVDSKNSDPKVKEEKTKANAANQEKVKQLEKKIDAIENKLSNVTDGGLAKKISDIKVKETQAEGHIEKIKEVKDQLRASRPGK